MAKQNEAAVRRVVAASLIGATIEWYDFSCTASSQALCSTSCISRPGTRWSPPCWPTPRSRSASSPGRWAG